MGALKKMPDLHIQGKGKFQDYPTLLKYHQISLDTDESYENMNREKVNLKHCLFRRLKV